MKCRLLTGFFLLFSIIIQAQQNLAVIDSFKAQLARAKTSEQKVWILGPLAMTLMNTNIAEADKYGLQLTQEAELSRNRSLMVKALLMNGQRYSFFQGNKAFLQKSLEYYTKALDLARKNKLEKETAEALLSISSLYSTFPDLDKAMALADETKDLEWQQDIAKKLDTVYATLGDFKQSRLYSSLYHSYKDSLQKLGEEKDLLQMELADEEQRQKRIEREEAEALRERHNIQYLGITIAIAVVFLLLVLMGTFRVSETTIKIMGFFAFILLFEFIILIADNKIHHWTHGEPLPILGIKIVLIAILLPLHHWLEHKVVHYLASRRLFVPTRKSIWHFFMPGKKKAVHHHHTVKEKES